MCYIFSVKKAILNFRQNSPAISTRPDDVVDTYEHALLAVFPRTRYLVGLDARYVLYFVTCLPERLGDWIVTKLRGYVPDEKLLKDMKHKQI